MACLSPPSFAVLPLPYPVVIMAVISSERRSKKYVMTCLKTYLMVYYRHLLIKTSETRDRPGDYDS